MEQEAYDTVEKPKDWPTNAIECQLENISIQLDRFYKNPSYKTKEVLISLISSYDLNQNSLKGLFRTTEYEVAQINALYISATVLNLNTLKTYLYDLVGRKTRMQKIASWFPDSNIALEIEQFYGLIHQLKLYYVSYQQFTVEKNGTFIDKIIETIELFIEHVKDSDENYNESINNITHSYITLVNDISYFRCTKTSSIWAFSRKEIIKLFELAGRLILLNNDSPIERPLKGVLMTSISNYILKSRNSYNNDYICKYLSQDVALKSTENHEIWMSIIEKLNDEREQKVIPEIFKNKQIFKNTWVRDINLNPTRKYYVSSFCKSLENIKMKDEYGECVYGYKDDRISDLIAPILLRRKNTGESLPTFSQVINFDVIYDKEEAKSEIELLCEILNSFGMTDNEKKSFLEEILQYWILSVKDEKWEYERERRYIIFLYDDYEYKEINLDDPNFLKVKTSLFIQPDFILGSNPVKKYLKTMTDNKRKSISLNPYQFCKDCLNRDFDIVVGSTEKCNKCSVCGSTEVTIENIHEYMKKEN